MNQPLTACANYVRGSLKLLQNRGDATEEVVDALKQAEINATRAGEIIRALRKMVSKSPGLPRPVQVSQLVEEACKLALIDAQHLGISVAIDVPDDLTLEADRLQIEQVLINLIRNAVEAMLESERRELNIIASVAGNYVEIKVADSGRGLAAEVAPQSLHAIHFHQKGWNGCRSLNLSNHCGSSSRPHRG